MYKKEIMHKFKDFTFSAFTLAEVLIVLGLIGIITELTIPGLIMSTQKQEVTVELKSAYSNLYQAVRLSEIDNGDVSGWTWPVANDGNSMMTWYNTYLTNYFKSTNVTASDTLLNVQLTNGVMLKFWCNGSDKIHIYVYLHGDSKTVFGKDVFIFLLGGTPTVHNMGKLRPYDYNLTSTNYSRDYLKSATDYGCNKSTYQAAYCAELIMTDGWQIKSDYPYFN